MSCSSCNSNKVSIIISPILWPPGHTVQFSNVNVKVDIYIQHKRKVSCLFDRKLCKIKFRLLCLHLVFSEQSFRFYKLYSYYNKEFSHHLHFPLSVFFFLNVTYITNREVNESKPLIGSSLSCDLKLLINDLSTFPFLGSSR